MLNQGKERWCVSARICLEVLDPHVSPINLAIPPEVEI